MERIIWMESVTNEKDGGGEVFIECSEAETGE